MQIHELLSAETTVVGLQAGTKESVLSEMVDLFDGHPAVTDLELIRDAILEREAEMSTGVGKGFGLPHAKTTGVSSTIAALAVIDGSVDFDAIDGDPVRILFLLVGPPDSQSQHVRILSRVSRLMNRDEVRDRFLASESAASLLELLEESENQLISH
ncbi:MAG: PTS sugar transporter subunit IIA [Rhodothermia bacterium]|nr:MAG: PTS sugar transporter subunit IIA [Rhodothermia bacterium]